MKKLLLLSLIVLSAGLMGCEKEKGMSQDEMNRYLKLESADLSGAEYLAIVGNGDTKSTPGNQDVYKIDKNGNMTALVFYFTYTRDENGNIISTEKRSNVRVSPLKITSVGGVYTMLESCSFIDENNKQIFAGIPTRYLIRNSDGVIFSLENKSGYIYISTDNVQVNSKKDVYFSSYSSYSESSIVKKIETVGDNVMIKDITPDKIALLDYILYKDLDVVVTGYIPNGLFKENTPSIYTKRYRPMIFYPDGSFEEIERDGACIIVIGDQLKLLSIEMSGSKIENMEIKNIVLSKTAPYSLSAVERKINYAGNGPRGIELKYAVECKDYYVIVMETDDKPHLLICHNNSQDIEVVKLDQELPSFENRVANMIFSIDTKAKIIKSYDFETFMYAEVSYNDSELGSFYETSPTKFITDPVAFVREGIRGTDGKPVRVEIDIKTGAVKVSTFTDVRNITQLVRLN